MTFRKSEIQRWKSKGPDEFMEGGVPKTVEHLKVTNPSALDKMNHMMTRNIKSLIIEDSEGTLTELPLNQALLYSGLVSFKLNWSCVKNLPHSLLHPGLKILDLEENHIHSLDGIGSARSLEKLILRNNHLQVLSDDIGSLNHLKELDFSMNKLKDLPSSLGSLNVLERLDVSQNRIRCLPNSIGGLKKLKFLSVTHNLLTSFPSTLSQLSNLEDLQASFNQLASLSYSFETLTSLKSLLLSKNRFKSLPSCLCSLPCLETLSMNGNKLQVVSDYLCSTKRLNLDNNQFSEMPKTIIDSPQLEHLWMRGNQLTNLREEISGMRNLQSLHLSNNPYLRRLPSSMVGMPSLRHIFLQHTQIEISDEIVQELSAKVFVHLDEETLGGYASVTPEMLSVSRFDSFHSVKNCGCAAGKLGLVADPNSEVLNSPEGVTEIWEN